MNCQTLQTKLISLSVTGLNPLIDQIMRPKCACTLVLSIHLLCIATCWPHLEPTLDLELGRKALAMGLY